MAIRSDGHELGESGLVFQPEHSPFADDSLVNSSRSGADRGDLSFVDERPSICQEVIHNVIGGSPFAVVENFCYSHPNEIISSRHERNSQQGDIEDCYSLIPVNNFQTRLGQLPDHSVRSYRSCGVGDFV